MARPDILDATLHKALLNGPSFTLSNRVYRAIWSIVWLTLASWTPPPFKVWRRLLLRIFGARMEKGSSVYPTARIWDPRNLEMGPYACIGPRVICYSMARITMGRYAVASQGAHLCAGTHDINGPDFQLIARPIFIGERAWIAADAFVGPGVTVGPGAILGARAVAFSDLPPWSVFVGNPARFAKVRMPLSASVPVGAADIAASLSHQDLHE
jgi:putative colanic acid biosynthesis acetyltransferase WcaF